MNENIKKSMYPDLPNAVYLSNPLIQARKNFDIIEMRIFLLALQGINPHLSQKDKFYDENFKEMFIPTEQLTELFGGNTWYLHELSKVCDKLFRTVIKISPKDGGIELYNLFRKLKYVPRKGLYIWFDDLMRPYLLDLFQAKGYTKLNVKYLFCLSSPYAVRLLELMLQYQNIKNFKEMREIKRRFSVEELRFALNVPEGAYIDRMDNFRARVADIAVKEINERTPYVLNYKTIKSGRRVVGFDFTLDTFDVPTRDEDDIKYKFSNDAITLLLSMGFKEKAAYAIFRCCEDVADCFSRINRAQALIDRQKTPVKNKLGFLRKAIMENWQIGRKPAKDDRELSPLSEIELDYEERPPKKQKDLSIGRKKIPFSIAKIYIQAITEGRNMELVNKSLADFKVTIAEFEAACRKRGLM